VAYVVYSAHACSVLIFVESGEPGGQALDGRLELGVHVDEGAKLLGQPLEADLFLAAARASSSMPRSVKYTPASLPSRAQRPATGRPVSADTS
jgi:hypothetical protein